VDTACSLQIVEYTVVEAAFVDTLADTADETVVVDTVVDTVVDSVVVDTVVADTAFLHNWDTLRVGTKAVAHNVGTLAE